MKPDALPESSTCSVVLTLPPYPSKEEMEKKLKIAVTEGNFSFGNV